MASALKLDVFIEEAEELESEGGDADKPESRRPRSRGNDDGARPCVVPLHFQSIFLVLGPTMGKPYSQSRSCERWLRPCQPRHHGWEKALSS